MKTVKPGIRFKEETKKYLATKSIKNKRYHKEFETLREAIHWKNTFRPSDLLESKTKENIGDDLDKNPTFKSVVEAYIENGMDELEEYTIYKKKLRMKIFLPNLYKFRMDEINRSVISTHIKTMKKVIPENSRRCNFDKELKDLSSIFNWYHEEHRHYPNPVTKKHFKKGFVKEVEEKERTMSVEEVKAFLSNLKDPFRSLALLQFLLGTRVSEVAALNVDVVDFKNRIVLLRDSISWPRGSPKYKKKNKTGSKSKKEMTPLILEILENLERERPRTCVFFFSRKGRPLRYNQIRDHYNKALKAAGLSQFSGTHIMRHSMATFARNEADLDTAQKMLSHKSARQTEVYAQLDADKRVSEVVLTAEKLLSENEVRATNVRPNENKLQ